MANRRTIVIRLQRPEQLFEADDVSPMSAGYTEFTAQPAMDTLRDVILMRMPPKHSEIELQVVLPAEQLREGLSDELTVAARRWLKVQNRMDVESTEAGGAIGRRLFLLGVVAFLILQTTAIRVGKVGDDLDNYLVQAISEGITVASWVMLWFPVQMFTMEVWRSQIRRRRVRMMERMTVKALWSGDIDGEEPEPLDPAWAD
jgi:hypothetical protein